MLKLKLQYFGHLVQRTDSLEKTLMLGNIEGGLRREQQRMRWLDGITEWTPGVGDGQGGLVCCSPWGHRVGHDWVTELNWTELSWVFVAAHKFFLGMASKCYSSLWCSSFSLQWLLTVVTSWGGGLGAGCGAPVVVAPRVSCSMGRGIFLNQGSNAYPLHWQVDS